MRLRAAALIASLALCLAGGCRDELESPSDDRDTTSDPTLDFGGFDLRGDPLRDAPGTADGADATCTPPHRPDNCAAVAGFGAGFWAVCEDGTLSAGWEEAADCGDTVVNYDYTCTSVCPGCLEGPIPGTPPATGADLVAETCPVAVECVPAGGCRLDHSCATESTDPEAIYCVAGACGVGPDCDVNCECSQDADCLEDEYCDRGACHPNTCVDDCQCGRFAQCADGICTPCVPTCASDSDCAPPDGRCVSYGFERSCTMCLDCPAGVDPNGSVTTPVITTDPTEFVDQRVTVVGTLFTHPDTLCDDLGPCGTCFPGLTLDGVIWLRGPDGAGHTLCGETVGCQEAEDTCLPVWECYPFAIGRRVRAAGTFRQVAEPPDAPWRRLASAYALDVEGIEVIESVSQAGRYDGTLNVVSVEGDGCPTTVDSAAIELVVAHSSEGLVIEPMAPDASAEGSIPVWAGWHTGQMDPADALSFSVESSSIGTFSGIFEGRTLSGSYSFGLSGPACRVTSIIEVEQRY